MSTWHSRACRAAHARAAPHGYAVFRGAVPAGPHEYLAPHALPPARPRALSPAQPDLRRV